MDEMILISTNQLKTLLEEVVRKAIQQKDPGAKEDQLLTIKEASAYLNLSTSTLYRYTSQRFIPHHKPGKQLYFIKAELDQWLASYKKLTATEIQEGTVIFKNTGTKKVIIPHLKSVNLMVMIREGKVTGSIINIAPYSAIKHHIAPSIMHIKPYYE